jgi:C4-dicarboxylate-specific signal transduction histidine kinase
VTTLGELTAAIAHEVNQPLTGVISSGNACQRWLAGDPPNLEAARRSIQRMIDDGNRASEVISRIRDMVRKSPPRKDALNINDTILEVLALLRIELSRNDIAPGVGLSNDLPLVSGDRIQLQQVILNLIMNAIEAMGGTEASQRKLLVASAKDGSNGVLVTIEDSGAGLDGESRDHLFEAFFTTKERGMGMGLAVSQTILQAHGGRLWATPNSSQGATFHFTLPANDEIVA